MKSIILIYFSLFLGFIAKAQSFQNGDLEGVVNGSSCLPDYWQNVPYTDVNCLATQTTWDTPDLSNLNGPLPNSGVLGNPFSGLYKVY